MALISGFAKASIANFIANVYFQNLTQYLSTVYGEKLTLPFVMRDEASHLIDGSGIYTFLDLKNKDLLPVKPHPLSIANIPILKATANLPFFLDLKPYVNYYNENIENGAYPIADLVPAQFAGLYFDPTLFAIVGTPTRAGTYQFSFAAGNNFSKAMPTNLTIKVGINQQEKPRFKKEYLMIKIRSGQNYQLNLMDLIEAKEKYNQNNPLGFRIDPNEIHPNWLSLDDRSSILSASIPTNETDQKTELTIIASTNTGGDSKPLKLDISISS